LIFSTLNDLRGGVRGARALPFLFAGLWLFVMLLASPTLARTQTEALTIVTSSGRHAFDVEIADSETEKAMGLMFRRSLPRRSGMLFVHDRAGELTMWMKNTFISLDMIFIRGNGVVHRIARGTEPFSEDIISSQGDVTAVLELAAGVADEIGLKPGDKIVHRAFKGAR
jgi:uncharacterized membrane protein (UPF0127 family)